MFNLNTRSGFSLHSQHNDRDLSRAAAERYQILSALADSGSVDRPKRRTRRLRRAVS